MKWTRGQLFLQRMRRKPNPWNAFVTERLDEANAGKNNQLSEMDCV
jgi:hypothetical protein